MCKTYGIPTSYYLHPLSVCLMSLNTWAEIAAMQICASTVFSSFIPPFSSLFCMHTWLNVSLLSCQIGLLSYPLRSCLPALPPHSPSCISVACNRRISDWGACCHSLNVSGGQGSPQQQEVYTAAGVAAGSVKCWSDNKVMKSHNIYLTGSQSWKLILSFPFSLSVA